MEQILKIKTIHATAVSIEDKGILIVGKSGSGKSSLALSLIAKGAHLICDDRANLFVKNKTVMMTKPPTLPVALEVRGLGLINVPSVDEAAVDLIVDMTLSADSRLGGHKMEFFGIDLSCVKGRGFHGLSDAITVWSRFGGFKHL